MLYTVKSMFRRNALYKLLLPLVALISFVAVFFLCDSFKDTSHIDDQAHTEGHAHYHVVVSNTAATTAKVLLSFIAAFAVVTLLGNIYRALLPSTIDLVRLKCRYLFLLRKLCNHIFESLRRGLLNPKRYNLAF